MNIKSHNYNIIDKIIDEAVVHVDWAHGLHKILLRNIQYAEMIKMLEASINSIIDKSFTMELLYKVSTIKRFELWLSPYHSLFFIYYNEISKLSYHEDREILEIGFTIYEYCKIKSQPSFELFCA